MTIWTIISIINILLWLFMAANVCYILFFAITSLLPKPSDNPRPAASSDPLPSFLVLFPAYHEDAVIIHSIETFLKQDYPNTHYQVAVISDHMNAETNAHLAQLPILLLQPTFEKSSKAKALQYAIEKTKHFDYVVILDADNVVTSDFLTKLSRVANASEAIQCHRTAKNADNSIAALDGISEEINNSIFRCGHNRIGMSSALIGSGMCFNYQWFKENVNQLDSAVEDRELEALLLKQRIFIRYAEDIYVMDEKVSNGDNFQRQRLRWMTGQVQAFFRMLPYIPQAIITCNINYIDKTIQQTLIPRSILLILVPLFTILSLIFFHFSLTTCLWTLILVILITAIFIAIPSQLRNKALLSKALSFPLLTWRMTKNLCHINIGSKEFLHTDHENKSK